MECIFYVELKHYSHGLRLPQRSEDVLQPRSQCDRFQKRLCGSCLDFGYLMKSTVQENKLKNILALILGFFTKDLLRLCPIFGFK